MRIEIPATTVPQDGNSGLKGATWLRASIGLTSLPGLAQERANPPHIVLVQDWSHRHIVFTDTNDVQTRVKASSDLRALSFRVKRTRLHSPHGRHGAAVEHHDEATDDRNKKNGAGGSVFAKACIYKLSQAGSQ